MVLSIFFISMCHRSISEAMKLLVRWYCAKYLWWCLWVYINLLRWFCPCRSGRKNRNERMLRTRGWNCFIMSGNPGACSSGGFGRTLKIFRYAVVVPQSQTFPTWEVCREAFKGYRKPKRSEPSHGVIYTNEAIKNCRDKRNLLRELWWKLRYGCVKGWATGWSSLEFMMIDFVIFVRSKASLFCRSFSIFPADTAALHSFAWQTAPSFPPRHSRC